MAIPRVFISSTYYDLKYIRNDIESFIKNLGYEPVLHEKNKIIERLEQSRFGFLVKRYIAHLRK